MTYNYICIISIILIKVLFNWPNYLSSLCVIMMIFRLIWIDIITMLIMASQSNGHAFHLEWCKLSEVWILIAASNPHHHFTLLPCEISTEVHICRKQRIKKIVAQVDFPVMIEIHFTIVNTLCEALSCTRIYQLWNNRGVIGFDDYIPSPLERRLSQISISLPKWYMSEQKPWGRRLGDLNSNISSLENI